MNKHVSDSDLVKLAEAKAIVKNTMMKINAQVDAKINAMLNKHPEMTETEVDDYRVELLLKQKLPTLNDSLCDINVHVQNCFRCRNKLNILMGVEEDLITKS